MSMESPETLLEHATWLRRDLRRRSLELVPVDLRTCGGAPEQNHDQRHPRTLPAYQGRSRALHAFDLDRYSA
jgi:hypothetical protein